MMNPRKLLTLTMLAIGIGTLSSLTLGQAIAQPAQRLAQATTPPNPEQPGRGKHRGPDFAAAAQKLGISEADLKAALGVPANPPSEPGTPGQRPRLDIKGAATKLGITEEALVNALGKPPRPARPNLAAAAQKLGVSEADLKTALGIPANPPTNPGQPGQRPPRPDLKAAAAKLGVSETQLIEALGLPQRPPSPDGNQPNGDRPVQP